MPATLALLFALFLPEAVLPEWDGGAPPAAPTRLLARDGVLLLGTDAGLYQRGSAGWRLVLARDGVRDLSPDGEGALVATAAGVYAWRAADGDTRELRLGAGAEPFGVAVDAEGVSWVATAAGLFRRDPAEREFARAQGVPPGEVLAVASAGAELWIATDGALLRRGADARFASRLSGLEPGWWELCGAVSVPGATLLCVPEGVWRVSGEDATRLELGIGHVFGLATGGGRIYAASELGLYSWPDEEAGRGAGRQELSVPARGLARENDALFVATEQGVARFALTPAPAPVSPGTGAERRALALARPETRASHIAVLQRAVLTYLELSPKRLATLEEKSRRTGFLPELRAGLSYDRDWTRGVDHDEVFTSGEQRRLLDSGNERGQNYQAALTFTWDLGQLASPDDALAISRERRSLVTLRDQVLERVNHLYFQRLRVLAQLDALPATEAAKRLELELDAAEIASQLDAWSGGLFSRLDPTSPLESEREP